MEIGDKFWITYCGRFNLGFKLISNSIWNSIELFISIVKSVSCLDNCLGVYQEIKKQVSRHVSKQMHFNHYAFESFILVNEFKNIWSTNHFDWNMFFCVRTVDLFFFYHTIKNPVIYLYFFYFSEWEKKPSVSVVDNQTTQTRRHAIVMEMI